jgi:chaperonin GroEL (HSP60 family)
MSKNVPNLTEDEPSHDTASVQEVNIQGGRGLAEMVRTTLGPNGMDKLLIDNDGMGIVTNHGATILGEMNVEMDLVPVARMLFKLAHAQDRYLGDGTTTTVVLAGELLKKAEPLLAQGVHPTTIADGYQNAAGRAVNALEDLSAPVSTEDDLQTLARVAMNGKGSGNLQRALPELVVESLRIVESEVGIDLDDVTIQKAIGGTISDSLLLSGLVITENEPILTGMPTRIEDTGVVCVSKEINPLESKTADVTVSNAAERDNIVRAERTVLDQITDRFAGHDVRVVFCSDDVGDVAAQHLATNGIFVTRRTTPDDLDAIARATGAGVISKLSQVDGQVVGRAGLVEQRYIGPEEVIVIQDCERPRTVSIILHGETKHVLNEAERAVRNAQGAVRATIEDGRVLPGGGALEIEVARRLREQATEIGDREQLVVDAFADALEVIPRTLAETTGMNPIDVVTELRNRHDAGEENAGIDVYGREITDTAAGEIVESLAVKNQSITGAADVVARAIRVDDLHEADDLSDLNF